MMLSTLKSKNIIFFEFIMTKEKLFDQNYWIWGYNGEGDIDFY